jgi:hypothetical protein
MSPSLLSLLFELVYRVVKDLLIKDAQSFLLCCRIIYNNGKHASLLFDKRCFRVLLVMLEHYGLLVDKDILKKQSYCFLKTVFI